MIIHAHFERLGIVQFESDGILLFQHLISVSAPASRCRQFSGQCIMGGKVGVVIEPALHGQSLVAGIPGHFPGAVGEVLNEDLLHPIAWLQALRQAGQHLVVNLCFSDRSSGGGPSSSRSFIRATGFCLRDMAVTFYEEQNKNIKKS